jgi:hypothetical protein
MPYYDTSECGGDSGAFISPPSAQRVPVTRRRNVSPISGAIASSVPLQYLQQSFESAVQKQC